MKGKNFWIATTASALVGILTIPTINNLPLPGVFVSLGTYKVAVILGAVTLLGYLVAEFLSRFIPVFRQIGRFAAIGVLNTVLDFAVLNILINLTGYNSGIGFAVIKGLSFAVAVTNSYYWNKYWAFEFKQKVGKEFLQFLVVSAVGLGLNIGAASLVVNVIGPLGGIDPTVWANLGALAGTFAGLAWNFLGYKFIVFKPRRSKGLT